MKKVCIFGHFGFGESLSNGQTIKTKIIANEIDNQLGKSEVGKVDTRIGLFALPKMFLQAGISVACSKNIIMLPAHNGLRFFAPVFMFWNLFFGRKLHYVVIGGWLQDFIKSRKWLSWCLKKFDYIYVETNTMQDRMQEQGFGNVLVMPNCKELKILQEDELVYPEGEPYKLCTFSRVAKEKGIEDAIEVVKSVNETLGRDVYCLDIYGQIQDDYKEKFQELSNSFPQYIKYCGIVPFDSTTEVLKNYFALLFPTRSFTEGIPGTIIDAYVAGVPVVAYRWKSFDDLVNNSIGFVVEFCNEKALKQILISLAYNPDVVRLKKMNCVLEAHKYLPCSALKCLISNLAM